MLEQHAPHVFALSTSPHKGRPRPAPRSILKKSSSEPTSPCSSICSWPLATPPTMPFQSESSVASTYQPSQWSVLSITKAKQRRSSSNGISSDAQTTNTSLTVTLIYTPTETLYAWPFNLSSPDAKGVCYETYSRDQHGGAPRLPPHGTMSTSLRVLAAVIRAWMAIRRERSLLAQHRGSTSDGLCSPTTSSIDRIVDDDEVVDEIIDALRLHQLTPFERSIYLLRQALPEQPTEKAQQPSHQTSALQSGRPQSCSSSFNGGSDDDQDWRHRSDSLASSRASTVETIPDDSPRLKQASSPKLSKINTAITPQAPEDPRTAVPQIRLVEATPQDSRYEERDRVLERAVASTSRNNSVGGRSMDTVLEDASEDAETDEATTSSGRKTINLIQIHSCERSETEEQAVGVTATAFSSPVTPSPYANKFNFEGSRFTPCSSSRILFRDPFKADKQFNSKPHIQVEAIEHGSPDSLLGSSKIKVSKRRSLDGLRSLFSSRSKSQ